MLNNAQINEQVFNAARTFLGVDIEFAPEGNSLHTALLCAFHMGRRALTKTRAKVNVTTVAREILNVDLSNPKAAPVGSALLCMFHAGSRYAKAA